MQGTGVKKSEPAKNKGWLGFRRSTEKKETLEEYYAEKNREQSQREDEIKRKGEERPSEPFESSEEYYARIDQGRKDREAERKRKSDEEKLKQDEERQRKEERKKREEEEMEEAHRKTADEKRARRRSEERIGMMLEIQNHETTKLLEEQRRIADAETRRERVEVEYRDRMRIIELKRMYEIEMSEEKDKRFNDIQALTQKKEDLLMKIQQEKTEKLDELNLKHAAEVAELNDKMGDLLRKSAEKQDEYNMKMIKIMESKGSEVNALMHDMALKDAAMAKAHLEMIANKVIENELAPVQGIKQDLTDNVTKSCELWAKLELTEEDECVKNEIMGISQVIKEQIHKLITTICKSNSLGEKKELFKKELISLDDKTAKYAKQLLREIREQETTRSRLRELEDECVELRMAILRLPDMSVESLESQISRIAQATIDYAASRVIRAPVELGAIEDEKMSRGQIIQ